MKYRRDMFLRVEDLEATVLRDDTMSDMDKLATIFEATKETIKHKDPYLYYAILAVVDSNKKPMPMSVEEVDGTSIGGCIFGF